MKASIVVPMLVLALTSGCVSYQTSPYGVSVKNVEQLKSLGAKPMAVNNFTAAEPSQAGIMCRAAGKVTVDPNFEGYIQKAFIDELKVSGLYDANAPLKLSGKLDSVGFSSGMTDGKWEFTLTVSNQSGTSFSTSSMLPFSGSFAAATACQEVAQTYSQAVQKLIFDVVRNPKFKELANQ